MLESLLLLYNDHKSRFTVIIKILSSAIFRNAKHGAVVHGSKIYEFLTQPCILCVDIQLSLNTSIQIKIEVNNFTNCY